jgi:hypothetical protein
MKIYIAGPMTGIKDFNFPLFFETENKLKELGHETLNPAANDSTDLETAIKDAISSSTNGTSWSTYLRRDLGSLVLSDAVCVLQGWQTSKGASLEVYVAKALGIPLYILRDGKLEPRVTCVGLAGWARSGKDTVADYLVAEHGYTKLSFAAPMKEALYKLNPKITVNNVVGTPIRIGVDIYGWDELKEHGPEIRGLLQRFGTEVGREMFGEDFWVNYALQNVPDGSKVVISDVRFPNEANAIKELGGTVWRITRDGVNAANEHISEHALDDYSFDGLLHNQGTIEHLQYLVKGTILNG